MRMQFLTLAFLVAAGGSALAAAPSRSPHRDKCNDCAKFIEMNQNFLLLNSKRGCGIRYQPVHQLRALTAVHPLLHLVRYCTERCRHASAIY